MEYNSILKGLASSNTNYNKNLIELLSNSNMDDSSSILSMLKVGQIFSGEITDIRGQMVQILINNEQMVSAKLLDTANFVIGQNLVFQVKEKKDGIIMIRPVISDETVNLPLQKALEAAGLTVTDKNVELVKTLMNEQQPIDKQTLTFYLKQMNTYPNSSINTLIFMNKNNIPFTFETINLLENYKNSEPNITNEFDHLSSEIFNVISEVSSKKGVQPALELHDQVIQLFFGNVEEFANENIIQKDQLFSPKAREELVVALEKFQLPEELKNLIFSNDSSAELVLKQLNQFLKANTLPEKDSFIKELFDRDSYKELFKETILRKILLDPKDLESGNKIKEYFDDVIEKNQILKTIFQSIEKGDSKVSQKASDINNNIRFMNSINEVFAYIQLPLKLSNQNAHGDLYVLRKKKMVNKGDELTAMLHLDLEYLGEVNVFVKLKGKSVNSTFTLNNQESVKIIEKNLFLLTAGLSKKGYQLVASVKEEDSKKDLVEEFLDHEKVDNTIKRYSFDVRA